MLQISVRDSGSQLPFLGLPQQTGSLRRLEKVVRVKGEGRDLCPAVDFNTK